MKKPPPPGRVLRKCPKCGVQVRLDRLQEHLALPHTPREHLAKPHTHLSDGRPILKQPPVPTPVSPRFSGNVRSAAYKCETTVRKSTLPSPIRGCFRPRNYCGHVRNPTFQYEMTG
jgi:hypothetical protein